MEAVTHLDTHVVVWLAGDKKRLKDPEPADSLTRCKAAVWG